MSEDNGQNGKEKQDGDRSDFGHIRHPKKQAFLQAYSLLGTVRGAAKAAKVDRQSHLNWLKAEGEAGEEYREAFEVARQNAAERLEAEAIRRAVVGVDEPVFYKGDEVSKVRKYSDTLLIFLMKGAMPHKYIERQAVEHTGRGGGPIRVTEAKELSDDMLANIARGSRFRVAPKANGEKGSS